MSDLSQHPSSGHRALKVGQAQVVSHDELRRRVAAVARGDEPAPGWAGSCTVEAARSFEATGQAGRR